MNTKKEKPAFSKWAPLDPFFRLLSITVTAESMRTEQNLEPGRNIVGSTIDRVIPQSYPILRAKSLFCQELPSCAKSHVIVAENSVQLLIYCFRSTWNQMGLTMTSEGFKLNESAHTLLLRNVSKNDRLPFIEYAPIPLIMESNRTVGLYSAFDTLWEERSLRVPPVRLTPAPK